MFYLCVYLNLDKLWQGVPLLYVPLESVISKWVGESERKLGTVFSHANMLPNGAIIFLDEVLEAFIAYSTMALCIFVN